ncbi:hypothetical protein [Mycoplasma bradburyae]|uniref:Haemagglutinin Mycoplasma domain-containing protein n=1 Tax=Mycoplasma bradburyae TaxID=2963128 RepID=A0ABT5GBA6_9MOLU|nr:hypothetical protein [Mycoplasma bradburyae]MDC4181756.1 hypothetical protein [Mycoplasma bradburyae]UTS69810.1 hypothetical protein NMG68_02170 [Mycoplasma bradburyae]
MKQKTKKLLQLSFSLGFLATTALVATSCKQPATVAPKPTNPMQPGNGSGSGETMQPENGSGSSGTGTTTPDNTEAKNQLDTVIGTKETNIALYSDYSIIKSELSKAYETAKSVSDKTNASKEELTAAKTTLETAINKAKTDKTAFDSENANLVNAYVALKNKLSSKEADLAMISETKYLPIKTHLANLYDQASTIISNTLQADPKPNEDNLSQLKTNIDNVVSKLNEEKTNLDQYSSFKMFKISEGTFSGDFKYANQSAETQKLVGFSSDLDNDQTSTKWRYANRIIDRLSKEDSSKITNVGWIYSLSTADGEQKTTASYDITFTYYGGDTAILYFPYKVAKADQTSNMLSLKYKLNNTEEWKTIDVTKAKVDSIEVASVNLSGLNFGENKISFSTDKDKIAPMIGNMYISINDSSKDDVYNNIFGNKKEDLENPNKITVNFAEAYGLANKAINVNEPTIIKKMSAKLDNSNELKDYYVIGYLGKATPGSNQSQKQNVRYYTFYVNAPQNGMYEISGIYNSHATGNNQRGLTFWLGGYDSDNSVGNVAKFNAPDTGNWDNTLKTFKKEQMVTGSNSFLQLSKGLNKIVVSGKEQNKEGPNLGNVTFTLKNNMPNTEIPNPQH